MNKTTIAVLFAAMLAGCASSAVLDADATSVPPERLFALQRKANAEQVEVIVTRDTGVFGVACDTGLLIDGKLAAAIGHSEQAHFFVDPGPHSIGISGYGHGLCLNFADQAIETNIAPGQRRRYRITVGQEFHIIPG